jgi:hypothetical protein
MTQTSPKLDIIIVNWNAGRLISECLESIGAASKAGFALRRVVVVDNGSTDGSVDDLNEPRLPVVLLRNEKNRGFAAACNQGTEGSEADYLLFLNPDTYLFDNSLSEPLDFMEHPSSQEIGILGIQLLDSQSRVSRSCARFPTPRHFLCQMLGLDRLSRRLFPTHFMLEWDHGERRQVDHVMGAFYLIRRKLFEKLAGFDERFFVYLEDLDLSLRAHKAGWRSFYLADAKAYHRGGGTSEQVMAMRLFYALRSRIFYGYKHFDQWIAAGLMLGTLVFEPWARLGLAVSMGSLSKAMETVKAYSLVWRSLPRWIFSRKVL